MKKSKMNRAHISKKKKRYTEGYLDALATIRYAVRGMLEEREKESEVQE